MALFIWKENFSVHIDEIDEQHKKYFEYVNQLHESIQSGEGAKVLDSLFVNISDYIRYHFSTEEEMLRILCYPGLPNQQKQHAYFETEIKALHEKYIEQSQVASSTLEFLRDWFLNHILDEDMKYGIYLGNIKTETVIKKRTFLGMPPH